MNIRIAQRLKGAPAWAWALAALGVMVVVTALRDPAFLRPVNIVNILNNCAASGIVATGMTLVILLGGIDLAVGALLALAGGMGVLAVSGALSAGWSQTAACLAGLGACLVAGAAAGALNGVLIAWGRLAPFIATLGALVSFRSAAVWIAKGGQFFVHGATAFANVGKGLPIPGTNIARTGTRVIPLEFPYAVMVWIAVLLGSLYLLHRTRLGRYIVAVGSNEKAARYAAVPVRRVKFWTYVVAGLLTGLASFLFAAHYESVNSANAGNLWELDAIAAVVIGGTRMEGGRGSLVGTLVGVLLLGVIGNMMVMLDVNTYAQGLVKGVIIVAAVLAQRAGSAAEK